MSGTQPLCSLTSEPDGGRVAETGSNSASVQVLTKGVSPSS